MELRQRYKQTEIGIIPEGWEAIQLKDITAKVIDNRGKTPPYSDDANIELVETASISFVNQYPDYSKITKFVSDNVYNYWFRGHPVKGDILISTVGEYSGSSAMMKENRGTIAQNIISLRIKDVNPTYVFYWTRSKSFKKQLNQVMMNQAQPSLRVPWLLKFYLSVPQKKAEQETIAKTLSNADVLIGGLEKLIAKKRNIKQGAMQQLLTGKKRLPGFNGKWEVKKLGKIGNCFAGGTPSTFNSAYWNGNIIWLPSGRVQNNILKKQENEITITKLGLDESSAKSIKPNSVLVAITGATCGNIGLLQFEAAANQSVIAIEPDENTDYRFLYYTLLTKRNDILINQNGSAQGGVNLTIIKNLEIHHLRIEEQTIIAQILSDMDAEIEALETKLEKYKMIKQGMMQELLTGKKRLI
jgi:type I restriction enzyme S subunit